MEPVRETERVERSNNNFDLRFYSLPSSAESTAAASAAGDSTIHVESHDRQEEVPCDNVWTTRRENENPYIIPDIWRGGTQGRQRFRVWVVNRGTRSQADEVRVMKVETGPDGTAPNASSAIKAWLKKGLVDEKAEYEARRVANCLWLHVEELLQRSKDALARVEAKLAQRAEEGLYVGQDGARSPKEILQAAVRAAYFRNKDAEEEALRWASDYKVPPEVEARDRNILIDWDAAQQMPDKPIEALAEQMRAERLPGRLNEHRVARVEEKRKPEWVTDLRAWDVGTLGEDWVRLKRFARDGVPILTPTRFVPTGLADKPEMRKRYRLMHTVVNKELIEGWWRPKLALILPLQWLKEFAEAELVPWETVNNMHFSSLQHVNQPGKRQGRPIIDPSNHKVAAHNLNGVDTRDACREQFGWLRHPSLVSVCKMIERVRERVGPTAAKRLVLAKADLKGAFSLLDIRSRDVALNAYEMEIDGVRYAMIMRAGYFGWTGFPFAFGVVS